MKSPYIDAGDYYNEQTKDVCDYEYQRWFSRKASTHSYNETLITLNNFLQDKQFAHTLEIGCGAGTWTKEITKHSDHVLGLDISENMVGFAKKKNLDSVEFMVMDFLKLDASKFNSYDCLISMRMLRFLDDIDLFFKKVTEVLAPKGFCFIIDVNPSWLKRKVLGAKEDELFDITLRSPAFMKLKMAEYGFKDIHVRPATIYLPPPFNPWLKLCDGIHMRNQNVELSTRLSILSESYAISGHL